MMFVMLHKTCFAILLVLFLATASVRPMSAQPGVADHRFGYAVSLSGDTALVGAPYDHVGTNRGQGSAYVFTRNGGTWTFQQQLTAPGGAAGDAFGSSVSLSGDTVLVGAPRADVGANFHQGSAYVFTRTGSSWTFQQQQLTASDGAAYDGFGDAVSLSGDTALIGAQWDDVGANANQGSAYVFVHKGTTWTFQHKLTASDGITGDAFGYSVAVSGDSALVGAPRADVGANARQGAAYVFTRTGTNWTFQQQLTASDGAIGDFFGRSVSLWGDTALIGAPFDDVAWSDQGSAYVFRRSGTTWTLRQHLTAPGGTGWDLFGYSVSLSGNTALVGTRNDYDRAIAEPEQGSAYVYVRTGTTWTFQHKLTASAGAPGDRFGYSVSLASDSALVGAPQDDVGGTANQGSANIFVRTGTTWTFQRSLTAPDGPACASR
jgi:hypothetical protein